RGTYRYVYDALGRRTEKQHISPDGKPYNRTKFLWDGMRLAQESRPEGTDSLYIYRDPGSYEPLARVDKAGKEGPNRILYFHTDVNGAPEEMTDSDGKIVWETGYQVWGNTIQEKDHGGVEQNLRYQGQYLDRETGLHYNLHRYYDPDVGRFMVTDPIGLRGGLNLYAYAPNPLGWIDPLGLSCGKIGKAEYKNVQRTEDYTARLLKNRPDFRYVSNYLTSKYKARLIVVKTDIYGNKYRFFDGVDTNGNRIELEIAHTGHKSVNGGVEPPHIKVKTKDVNNKTTNIDKYFLEEDIYRIMGK
ncbi:TPA: RHS repeat-associated core domain-containing protein, partial [Escherichia coli]